MDTQAARTPYDSLLRAGDRLLAAMAEEQRVTRLHPTGPDLAIQHREAVSAARHRVDECAREYCEALAECEYPDVPIRHVIECELARD